MTQDTRQTSEPNYAALPHPPAELVRSARAEAMPFLGTFQVLEALDKDEVGDAELLSALYADRVVFDYRDKKWFLWGGQHWVRDDTSFMVRLVSEGVAAQYLRAAAHRTELGVSTKEDKSTIDALIKRARGLRYKTRIQHVLDLARSQPIGDWACLWDGDPWLLACPNGTINLSTGTLQPGVPSDYIRTVCPIRWRGLDAPAPRWERFLREVFVIDGEAELELIEFVQRLLGYGITGSHAEHILPILWGEDGFNGKDTLLSAIKYVLGPWAGAIARSVLLESGRKTTRSATPDRIDLAQKRIVWASESEEGERLKAGVVKLLTGGGEIPARQMYKSDIERLRPQHLPMLMTNYKPRANADDKALWERLLLIPFTQRFVDVPEKPNEHPRDEDLSDKLEAEASGILAWLVVGCLEWQTHGLKPPASVQVATADYKAKEDTLGQFLSEKCITGPMFETPAGAFYKVYKEWCIECSVEHPLSVQIFSERMTKRFVKTRKTRGVLYCGVGLPAAQTP